MPRYSVCVYFLKPSASKMYIRNTHMMFILSRLLFTLNAGLLFSKVQQLSWSISRCSSIKSLPHSTFLYNSVIIIGVRIQYQL